MKNKNARTLWLTRAITLARCRKNGYGHAKSATNSWTAQQSIRDCCAQNSRSYEAQTAAAREAREARRRSKSLEERPHAQRYNSSRLHKIVTKPENCKAHTIK